MDLPPFTRNSHYRTLSGTSRTTDTLVWKYVVTDKALALASGTFLIHNVGYILVMEVMECGKDRIRRSLSEGTE
jgi:hypothetical protein